MKYLRNKNYSYNNDKYEWIRQTRINVVSIQSKVNLYSIKTKTLFNIRNQELKISMKTKSSFIKPKSFFFAQYNGQDSIYYDLIAQCFDEIHSSPISASFLSFIRSELICLIAQSVREHGYPESENIWTRTI